MISEYLLARDEYEMVRKKYKQVPSTLTLKKDNQSIYYFGANHSRDPENEQYGLLRTYWKEFLEETKGEDRAVLIEGGLRVQQSSETEAIKRGSEGALISLIATKERVEVQSHDIELITLISECPEKKREIADLYWFLANLDNYLHITTSPKESFESWFTRWHDYSQQNMSGGFEPCLSDLKKSYKKFLGKEFSPNRIPNDLLNPNNTNTPVNKIAQEISDIREVKVINGIEELWKKGKSLFIVFGHGHLIIQEPALRKLVS